MDIECIVSDSSSPNLSTDAAKFHPKPNYLFGDGINPSAIHIAIDWDPTALHLRYQSTRERVSINLVLYLGYHGT